MYVDGDSELYKTGHKLSVVEAILIYFLGTNSNPRVHTYPTRPTLLQVKALHLKLKYKSITIKIYLK